MNHLRITDLRDIARSQGLKGYSRLKKSDLISFIKDNENLASDQSSETDIKVWKKTVKELKVLAQKYNVKIHPKANKSEIIYLLGENYGERRRAVYEKKYGLWNSDIMADEEIERWTKEIEEEERIRRPAEVPAPVLRRKFKGGQSTIWFVDGSEYLDPEVFLYDVEEGVKKMVDEVKKSKKVSMNLSCILEKEDAKTGNKMEDTFGSRSKTKVVTLQLGDAYGEMRDKMLENLAEFQKNGSGWRLKSIYGLEIKITKYNPLSGLGYSKLPPFIAKKNIVINMRNDDTQCFKWAATRALNPVADNPNRITNELKKQTKKYNWEGISFPTKLTEIGIWEKNNNFNVNVFSYDETEKEIYTNRLGELKEPDETINLYLHDDNHYCVIKDLNRLVSSQLNKSGHAKEICLRCLNFFRKLSKKDREDPDKKSSLEKHMEICSGEKLQHVIYPKPGETVQFRNYERLHDVPFVVYADFESFVSPLDVEEKDPNKSYTVQYQSHIPSGFCYTIRCMDETVYPTKTVLKTASYEGEDMGRLFVETLSEDFKPIYDILKTPKPMIMNNSDKTAYEKSEKCYACGIQFGSERINEKTKKKEKIVKCRDHCHITGKYRGAACGKCNLKMKVSKFVPVLFHNLEGYDSHLFVKSLGLKEGDISCIPKMDEKYISLSKKIPMEIISLEDGKTKTLCLEMRFLDSMKFMSKSLDSLVKTLGKDKFTTLTSQMSVDETSLELLKRKGVFPYEYMSNFSKLSAKTLPPKDAFYSKLTDSHISDSDYKHAQNVWKTFDCKTMKDYHDLYLKTDVLLLADVMTEFRKTCKKAYGLDALHNYTSPGLAWSAMLKYTEVKLDLISDPDMYLFVEKGIRGGISTVVKRYAKSNNKYLDNYDKESESVFIPYLDANNLYGWAMNNPLPVSNFEWIEEDKLKYWESAPCILEVDLEYPIELHDLHNEYPLAPEKINVNKIDKLIPNLNDKTNYVIHHETLKLYLSLGLKLKKIHRGITFDEEDFMKPYIKLNTDMRAKGTTDFEKDFYKLMNNSVFGKTMENVRNRVNVKLVSDEKALGKLAKKANFKSVNIFDENLIAVHMEKTTVRLNKPIQIGMSILDLSKTLMYKFHYEYVKPKWGDRAELLFTDTDSLCYKLKTNDFYKDISEDTGVWFDTSGYEKDHALYSAENKKKIGYMKDECCGNQIIRFCRLRSKLYAYEVNRLRNGKGKWEYNVEKKKCKGIREYVVKKNVTIDNYEACLFSGKPKYRTMNVIRSRGHNICSEKINKKALSSDDDKRIILPNKIDTLAIGHHKS